MSWPHVRNTFCIFAIGMLRLYSHNLPLSLKLYFCSCLKSTVCAVKIYRARVYSHARVNPRTCRGVERTPHGFSQITRVKRSGSPQNLQYLRVHFDTCCGNSKSMSCQVIKLWRHMSGHVRAKSAYFLICRTMVRNLASQRRVCIPWEFIGVYGCLNTIYSWFKVKVMQGHAS